MKILFTEDEIAMSEAVVDILTYHKYIVDAVYNGEDAYGYASTEKYDGIIIFYPWDCICTSGYYDAQNGWA